MNVLCTVSPEQFIQFPNCQACAGNYEVIGFKGKVQRGQQSAEQVRFRNKGLNSVILVIDQASSQGRFGPFYDFVGFRTCVLEEWGRLLGPIDPRPHTRPWFQERLLLTSVLARVYSVSSIRCCSKYSKEGPVLPDSAISSSSTNIRNMWLR